MSGLKPELALIRGLSATAVSASSESREKKGPGTGLFGIALQQRRVMDLEGKCISLPFSVNAGIEKLVESVPIDAQGPCQTDYGQKSTANEAKNAMGFEPESTLTKEILDRHRNGGFLKLRNPEGYPKLRSRGDSKVPGSTQGPERDVLGLWWRATPRVRIDSPECR